MRKSDEERFREFARAHSAALRRSAYLLCGDWHLADDLVQTTLMKMYGAWKRVSRAHHPVGYARKILLRCWLDERRRPWRRSESRGEFVPERPDPGVGPADAAEQEGLRAELMRALGTLAPRKRAVLVLRFFESLSVGETAEALACSEGTVKSQTARGLDDMRAALGTESAAVDYVTAGGATTGLRRYTP